MDAGEYCEMNNITHHLKCLAKDGDPVNFALSPGRNIGRMSISHSILIFSVI